MIVIDTHVLIWYISSPDKLSKKAQKAIEKELHRGLILVSAISVWEIYMLVKSQRLKLSMDIDSWMEKIESLSFLQFIPVDNRIAAKSVSLPGNIHNDPADRIIIATARDKGLALVTSDKRLQRYKHVQTIW